MHEQRIISLLPSATEIVVALGLQDQLVGRSHECDYPPEALSLPICSQPKRLSKGTSPEISREVRSILQEALSIYRVDVDMIEALMPTHIITQSQCAVCAVSLTELREALSEYVRHDPIEMIDLQTASWDDALENIRQVGDALGVHQRGEQLAEQMSMSLNEIVARTALSASKPCVAHLEWIEPPMLAGGWTLELIEAAGGVNAFPASRNPWIRFEELVELDPDKIIIAPCGFSIERAVEDLPFLEQQPGWKDLKAAQNHEIVVCDGNHYFNRPGPRLIDSLEILAEIFHPDLFPAEHYNSGWIRLTSEQMVR